MVNVPYGGAGVDTGKAIDSENFLETNDISAYAMLGLNAPKKNRIDYIEEEVRSYWNILRC